MNFKQKNNRQTDWGKSDENIKATYNISRNKGREKRGVIKVTAIKGAENRLKKFRQSTILAVAVTGFILLLFSGVDMVSMEDPALVPQPDTTELLLKISAVINKPDYKNIIIPVYPRQQIQIIDAYGIPVDQGEK